MNNYRAEISRLFDKATHSIQIAVPWFTDDFLLEKLIEKARTLRVELLLSADLTNILKYDLLRKLEATGAKLQKIGGTHVFDSSPFMHTKLVIIDQRMAWGGSYNFTSNAQSNYELFDEYAQVHKSLDAFKNWFSESFNLFRGWDNPAELKQQVLAEYAQNDIRRKNFQENLLSSIDKHKLVLVDDEIRKGNLREVTTQLAQQTALVTANGTVQQQQTGQKVATHRNYGGKTFGKFVGNKPRNVYGYAYYQKLQIEKHYNFLHCSIENDILIATGKVELPNCPTYRLRIEFRAGYPPKVFVVSPTIPHHAAIHVYNDGSLCLYYPPDMNWTNLTSIAAYTIPWAVEWIYLYELWKLTGKWEGAEVAHSSN
jgi:hypothetical protein